VPIAARGVVFVRNNMETIALPASKWVVNYRYESILTSDM